VNNIIAQICISLQWKRPICPFGQLLGNKCDRCCNVLSAYGWFCLQQMVMVRYGRFFVNAVRRTRVLNCWSKIYTSNSINPHFLYSIPYMTRSQTHISPCVGHMRTYKISRGPHYDAYATIAVLEPTRNSFYTLFPAKGFINYSQSISSRLYVRINHI